MQESPIASHEIPGLEPLITVAIPHYKWPRHLAAVLGSLFEQRFADFEIVVSDDCSPDDSPHVIPPILSASGRQFRYYRQAANLGYDGNVRFCLSAARGRYVMLLGNDDALAGPDTLNRIAEALRAMDYPEAAFTNFEEWANPGIAVQRAVATRVLGDGVSAAVRFYRSFSFVSGLLFDRECAKRHDTDKWDRSVYYQIYLGARIASTGGRIASIAVSAIRKDVRIDGKTVVTYATRAQAAPRSFAARHTGLDNVIRVAADATLPYVQPGQRSATLRKIIAQIFTITYPFWILEYRRVSRWSLAVGVARSMLPGRLLREFPLNPLDRAYLIALYWVVTLIALVVPVQLFSSFRGRLGNLVRRRQQTVPASA
ncbi:MAG TPA: glycosyltransferase family 2 protein [Gemmatimonadaceae bacterium]|nr:glycosyltransferase family 2 protein [Gemmatimonadaceae bacterium]